MSGIFIPVNPADNRSRNYHVTNEEIEWLPGAMYGQTLAMRVIRYLIRVSAAHHRRTINLIHWRREWDARWEKENPNNPNPGFRCIVIPTFQRMATVGSLDAITPDWYNRVTYYPTLVTEILEIERASPTPADPNRGDTQFDLVFNVTGFKGGDPRNLAPGYTSVGFTYSIRTQGWFAFTVLGGSKNLFLDDGTVQM